MDQTLKSLGGILLSSLPTLFLVFLLHLYLKFTFFKPLEKVLKQRREATEGAREAAENSMALARRKAAEYEAKLREARGDIYKEQEQLRRSLRDDQSAGVQKAREESARMVADARAQLAADVEAARQSLDAQSDAFAEQIAARVLQGSVHA